MSIFFRFQNGYVYKKTQEPNKMYNERTRTKRHYHWTQSGWFVFFLMLIGLFTLIALALSILALVESRQTMTCPTSCQNASITVIVINDSNGTVVDQIIYNITNMTVYINITENTTATGPPGPPGINGTCSGFCINGTDGTPGVDGINGTDGAPGVDGINGTCPGVCVNGTDGLAGPPGLPGTNGTDGLPGINGTNAVTDYADFFALMPNDNAATVASNADVQFPQSGPAKSGTGILPSSATEITLPSIGIYEVSFFVSISEAAQLALSLNNVVDVNTVTGRATGTNYVMADLLITTTVINTLLTVRNVGLTALTITPIAGGPSAVSAHLKIIQLS